MMTDESVIEWLTHWIRSPSGRSQSCLIDGLRNELKQRTDALRALQAQLKTAREALRLSERELGTIAEYSGSAGNWPLHEAYSAVRAALAALDKTEVKP